MYGQGRSKLNDFDDYEEHFRREVDRCRDAMEDLKDAKLRLFRIQRELQSNQKENKVLQLALEESREELRRLEDSEAHQRSTQERSLDSIHRQYQSKLALQKREYDSIARELSNVREYSGPSRNRELGVIDLKQHDTLHSLSDVIEYKNGELGRLYELCVILKDQNGILRDMSTLGSDHRSKNELHHKKCMECNQLQTMHSELRRKLHELQCSQSLFSPSSMSNAPPRIDYQSGGIPRITSQPSNIEDEKRYTPFNTMQMSSPFNRVDDFQKTSTPTSVHISHSGLDLPGASHIPRNRSPYLTSGQPALDEPIPYKYVVSGEPSTPQKLEEKILTRDPAVEDTLSHKRKTTRTIDLTSGSDIKPQGFRTNVETSRTRSSGRKILNDRKYSVTPVPMSSKPSRQHSVPHSLKNHTNRMSGGYNSLRQPVRSDLRRSRSVAPATPNQAYKIVETTSKRKSSLVAL